MDAPATNQTCTVRIDEQLKQALKASSKFLKDIIEFQQICITNDM